MASGWTRSSVDSTLYTLSLGTGRTAVLQGAVHLAVFAVYLFTTIVP